MHVSGYTAFAALPITIGVVWTAACVAILSGAVMAQIDYMVQDFYTTGS